MTAWLPVGVSFLVLLIFWKVLELTFDLIVMWHAERQRDDDEPVGEAGKPPIGAESST